jgi:hypothetical protein
MASVLAWQLVQAAQSLLHAVQKAAHAFQRKEEELRADCYRAAATRTLNLTL